MWVTVFTMLDDVRRVQVLFLLSQGLDLNADHSATLPAPLSPIYSVLRNVQGCQSTLSRPWNHFSSSLYPFTGLPSEVTRSMFSRLSQVARHLSRPLPNYAHRSAAALTSSPTTMTSSTPAFNSDGQRMIHTAGCIIIGDEVLGGKVHLMSRMPALYMLINGSLHPTDN